MEWRDMLLLCVCLFVCFCLFIDMWLTVVIFKQRLVTFVLRATRVYFCNRLFRWRRFKDENLRPNPDMHGIWAFRIFTTRSHSSNSYPEKKGKIVKNPSLFLHQWTTRSEQFKRNEIILLAKMSKISISIRGKYSQTKGTQHKSMIKLSPKSMCQHCPVQNQTVLC